MQSRRKFLMLKSINEKTVVSCTTVGFGKRRIRISKIPLEILTPEIVQRTGILQVRGLKP